MSAPFAFLLTNIQGVDTAVDVQSPPTVQLTERGCLEAE